jgi:hypothetical protein
MMHDTAQINHVPFYVGISESLTACNAYMWTSSVRNNGSIYCYLYMCTGLFPGVKWPGRGLTTHPYLAPRLKKE